MEEGGRGWVHINALQTCEAGVWGTVCLETALKMLCCSRSINGVVQVTLKQTGQTYIEQSAVEISQ